MPSPYFNDRLAAACDGRAAAPEYASLQVHAGVPVLEAAMRRPVSARTGTQDLPLPET
jgi:hypothetical protein